MTIVLILVALDLLGLGAIWLYTKARLNRALELDSLLDAIRKEVRALNIELNETADRNISLVEDRMDALRALLEEADRRMGVARRELERQASEREVYSRLGRPLPARAAAGAEGDARPAGRPVRDRPEGFPEAAMERPIAAPASPRGPAPRDDAEARALPGGDGRQGAGSPASRGPAGDGPIRLDLGRRAPEIVQAKESVIPPKSLREEALELYFRGFSADIIAARLGATVAEIDLLISLEEERRQMER